MKYKGAIFDMDGLLFDTEKIYQETWQEIAAQYQVVLDDAFPHSICATSGEHMNRVIEKFYHVEDGSAIQEQCMAEVKRKLSEHVPLKAGAEEILKYFEKEGLQMAIASGSSLEQIEANLEKCGFRHYFAKVISSQNIPNGKPAPDVFLLAAEELELLPEQCFVFEDSSNGIIAGHRAGCTTVMVPDTLEPSKEALACCNGIYQDLFLAMKAIELEEL